MVQAKAKFILNIAKEEGQTEMKEGYSWVIPNYQRPYSWTLSNCQDLWDSFISLIDKPQDEPYFMGSIIIKDNKENQIDIIDGQQRITSISLILLYLYHNVQQQQHFGAIRKFIFQQSNNDETKLLLQSENTSDNESYTDLYEKIKKIKNKSLKEIIIEDNEEGFEKAKESLDKDLKDLNNVNNVYERNYQYFILCIKEHIAKKHIAKQYISIDDLATDINRILSKKIQVIEVILAEKEDQIEIFNNMNAKGLPLSTENLVKSKLFANLKDDDNELNSKWDDAFRKADEKFWDKHGNHNNFFQFYFKIVLRNQLKLVDKEKDIRKIYLSEYLKDNPNDENNANDAKVEEINQILGYVEIYKELCQYQGKTQEPWYSFIYLCNRKNTYVLWPILMLAMKENKEKIKEIATALENVLMHLHIHNKSLNSLNNDLFTILKDMKDPKNIKKQDIYNNFSSYKKVEKTNDGIKELFNTKHWNNKHASILLQMIEIYLQLKHDPRGTIIYEFKGFNKVSLEHIYPQTQGDWSALAEDNNKYLIGNMILLNGPLNKSAQNSLLSNKYVKYATAKANATKLETFPKIDGNSSWDDNTIKARCEDLYKEFIALYPYNAKE
jgi:uncharacterized protein with ParB-like and HNH nuclease domain